MVIHAIFDVLAWLAAALSSMVQQRLIVLTSAVGQTMRLDYVMWLIVGAALGAFGIGTLNQWMSGLGGVARSIEGALMGAIIAVETFKWSHGLSERTGARFALPFAVGVAVGRIGCFLAGMDDFTYGTPTTLPWAHDFGDGVPRHPVQLYESAAMLIWAGILVRQARRAPAWYRASAFYATVGVYGAQRFLWEFMKPYASVLGPLTVFHFVSLALVLYACYGLSQQAKAAA